MRVGEAMGTKRLSGVYFIFKKVSIPVFFFFFLRLFARLREILPTYSFPPPHIKSSNQPFGEIRLNARARLG